MNTSNLSFDEIPHNTKPRVRFNDTLGISKNKKYFIKSENFITQDLLFLLIVTSVSAQLDRFEGFWMSKDTSFNTLITHNSNNDLLTLKSFSFNDNTLIEESIKSVGHNEINTISISENNWKQESSKDALNDYIIKAVSKYPEKVIEYKSGKKGLIGLFMGEVMKISKGQADPKIANKLLRTELEK